MNNSAILRQTPTLLITRWLIDPNGNVYQRDAKDENIIILPRLIAVFKGGRPKGNFWMFEIIGKVHFRGSSVVLSLRGLQSFYSTYKRLWDIQYYIPKQFSEKIKHGGGSARSMGCCNFWWSDINVVESVVSALHSRPQCLPDTSHPSKLHYPRSIITVPNSKGRMLLFFRAP